MTDLVQNLAGALEECLDDSHQVLAQMEQMYGTNYRQDRLEAQRKTIADAEAALSAAKDGGWVSPYDSVPQPDQTVLVWSRQTWETAPSLKIDTWSMQREAPLSFSTATIETGYGWDEHENFESVIAWQPLPNPPKDPA